MSELGLQASKSIILMTGQHPRIGWVRADKAKSVQDFQQVEALRAAIAEKDEKIEELEDHLHKMDELVRGTILPDEDIQPELLAQGDDLTSITVKATIEGERQKVELSCTWDELFSVIGPALYNIRMRRSYDGRFDFEKALLAHLREKSELDGAGTTIRLQPASVDAMLFQFKQLGFLLIETDDNGYAWWTLTPKGEAHLTKLLVAKR